MSVAEDTGSSPSVAVDSVGVCVGASVTVGVGVGLSVTVGVGVVRTVDVISVVDVVSVVNVADVVGAVDVIDAVDVVGVVDVIDVVAMSTSGTVEVTSVVCKIIVTVAVGAKGPKVGVAVSPMLMIKGDKCILLLRGVSGVVGRK